MIVNIHERTLNASHKRVTALVASLSSADDALWPRQWWPAMRFDRPLQVGAVGGHGPIRYAVERCDPAQAVVFRFTGPKGFDGTHAYHLDPIDKAATRMRHELRMRVTGAARFSWPLVYRPLHDALIEDSFIVAEASLDGTEPIPTAWSVWVRSLRALLA